MKRSISEKKGKQDITSFFKVKKAEPKPKEEIKEIQEQKEESKEPKEIKEEEQNEIWSHPLFQYLTEPGWRKVLEPVIKKYIKDKDILSIAKAYETQTIYPPKELIFNAFNSTPFDKVKVVIIGQDPYIKQGQAHGLCFSVNKGIAIPPSLKNIYKELQRTIDGFQIPKHGYLMNWADQGVLMLNATLTVIAGKSNSHEKLWKNFTDDILAVLSKKKTNIVYMLWGNFAQKKASGVNSNTNYLLKAPHPSPLAQGGFDNNNHFVLCNDYLKKHNIDEIDWKLPLN